MRLSYICFLVVMVLQSCITSEKKTLSIPGLKESVEILRDEWGVNHIYANNQYDLFFTQGYAAAKDRLFQFEMWRRQATGTVAEILGEKELDRDIGSRLFKFRGDMVEELNHYHNDGEEIITAFTDGVNAYIEQVLDDPDQLPIEFKILNIVPKKWTPEVVVSRHQGLLHNIENELKIGRSVAKLGTEVTKNLFWFHPNDPDISIDSSIDGKLLLEDILKFYTAFKKPIKFQREHIHKDYISMDDSKMMKDNTEIDYDKFSIGSNNWVMGGERMTDGNTYMANDPHRTVSIPSLRYIVHLNAPGWDVIGGGEPAIPGVSIGHNDYGAWGLTIFQTDAEDLYVYDIDPSDRAQYKYKGDWERMDLITETINIRDGNPVEVDLFFTRHGPVVHVDSINNKAYAVRCAWLEVGCAPYLASLRMNQSKTWDEFREACTYSYIPGENMVWADKDGNIGWQAVGITPIRRNFSGLVPVPGDGRYEWGGYLPIEERPHAYNPSKGFFATANQNVTPPDYKRWDGIGYSWADPYRGDRINEVLDSGQEFTMREMRDLQNDYLSIPARILTPYLIDLTLSDKAREARDLLVDWDYKLLPNSIEAAIYVSWETEIKKYAVQSFVPDSAEDIIKDIQLKKIIDWIENPDSRFGSSALEGRDEFLEDTFEAAVVKLKNDLGEDIDGWQYGQSDFKHIYLEHPLSEHVNEEIRTILDRGPIPRGGNGYTVGSTGNNYRQSSGALFKLIVNTGDWDFAIATNGAGQSGNPESPFYSNLFESWADDDYFPLYFSREKIESSTVSKLNLKPIDK